MHRRTIQRGRKGCGSYPARFAIRLSRCPYVRYCFSRSAYRPIRRSAFRVRRVAELSPLRTKPSAVWKEPLRHLAGRPSRSILACSRREEWEGCKIAHQPTTAPWDQAEALARNCSAGFGVPFTTFDPILTDAKRKMRELVQVAARNNSVAFSVLDLEFALLTERLKELADSTPGLALEGLTEIVPQPTNTQASGTRSTKGETVTSTRNSFSDAIELFKLPPGNDQALEQAIAIWIGYGLHAEAIECQQGVTAAEKLRKRSDLNYAHYRATEYLMMEADRAGLNPASLSEERRICQELFKNIRDEQAAPNQYGIVWFHHPQCTSDIWPDCLESWRYVLPTEMQEAIRAGEEVFTQLMVRLSKAPVIPIGKGEGGKPLVERPPLPGRIEIFFSYSHSDEKQRDALAKHLSQLKHEGKIKDWHDRKIGPGEEWAGVIDEHLEAAEVILLLISSDFLASRYCYDLEMTRAIARHKDGNARVIPVILRPCDWGASPFAKLLALPTDGKAITTWSNKDLAYTDVAKGIRKVVDELTAKTDKPTG